MKAPTTLTLLLFAATAYSAGPAAPPLPCEVLPADVWNSVMTSTATATPGDGVCTYDSKSAGGQLRIMAVAGSSAEAAATAQRMNEKEQKGHHAGLGVIDSQGPVVFSIALFQHAPTEATAGQLKKLVTAIKLKLPK